MRRIDLAAGNIEIQVEAACQAMAASGHKLVASFVFGTELYLIFVK
jgi:hypothetical protein